MDILSNSVRDDEDAEFLEGSHVGGTPLDEPMVALDGIGFPNRRNGEFKPGEASAHIAFFMVNFDVIEKPFPESDTAGSATDIEAFAECRAGIVWVYDNGALGLLEDLTDEG